MNCVADLLTHIVRGNLSVSVSLLGVRRRRTKRPRSHICSEIERILQRLLPLLAMRKRASATKCAALMRSHICSEIERILQRGLSLAWVLWFTWLFSVKRSGEGPRRAGRRRRRSTSRWSTRSRPRRSSGGTTRAQALWPEGEWSWRLQQRMRGS
eukprot:6964719-Prymnesium_polylepis.1